MKLGIIANSYFNIYHFRKPLVDYFLKQRIPLVIIAPNDSYKQQLVKMGCRCIDIQIYRKGYTPLYDLFLIYKIYRCLKKEQLEILLSFTVKPNIYASLASAFCKTKIIATITGLGSSLIRKGRIAQIIYCLYRISFLFSKHTFFHNPDDLKLFLNKKIASLSKVSTVPGSGIDLVKWQPVKNKVAPHDRKTTFLVACRLIYEKGIFEYVDAIQLLKEKYPNARFQIIGGFDGEAKFNIPKEDLQNWISEGLIEYFGFQKDTRSWITKADCIVLPSYREGLPRILLEAMAIGKPIIATHTAGCRELIIEGKNGYFCEVKSAESLAQAMQKILESSSQELVDMGMFGRQIVEKRCSQEIVIKAYMEKIVQLTQPLD